ESGKEGAVGYSPHIGLHDANTVAVEGLQHQVVGKGSLSLDSVDLELERLTLKTPDPYGKAAAVVCDENDHVDFLGLFRQHGLLFPQLTPALRRWSPTIHLRDAHWEETLVVNAAWLLHQLALLDNSVD